MSEFHIPWADTGRRFRSREQVVDTTPEVIRFEGINIQWNKGRWDFVRENGEAITKDTYSIYNPANWSEIAKRLTSGEKCAMMVAGAQGVAMLFEDPDWQDNTDETSEFNKLEPVKKGRPWGKNFVAFAHPDNQAELIDFDRLSSEFRHLRWANRRHDAYAWAQHNIYPARIQRGIDKGLIKQEDQTIACFWINGHWGFEGLVSEMRRKVKHGVFGGGSLNFHGENPGFTSKQLELQMREKPEWLEHIDFVIFDEIVEAGQIQRSQPMVSFALEHPTLVRHGSLSMEKISELTGYNLQEALNVLHASSSTPYDSEHNELVDERALQTKDRIARLQTYLHSVQFI